MIAIITTMAIAIIASSGNSVCPWLGLFGVFVVLDVVELVVVVLVVIVVDVWVVVVVVVVMLEVVVVVVVVVIVGVVVFPSVIFCMGCVFDTIRTIPFFSSYTTNVVKDNGYSFSMCSLSVYTLVSIVLTCFLPKSINTIPMLYLYSPLASSFNND